MTVHCWKCHKPCVPYSKLDYPLLDGWGEVVIGSCCHLEAVRVAERDYSLMAARVDRRLAEIGHVMTDSYRRHAVEHQSYNAACSFCRWEDADR